MQWSHFRAAVHCCCMGREIPVLRVLPTGAATGHPSRAIVGAQNRSESTSVVLAYGKLSQDLPGCYGWFLNSESHASKSSSVGGKNRKIEQNANEVSDV